MAFSRATVNGVASIMFVVLFYGDVQYHVKASDIFLANVGENLTLNCRTGISSGPIYWHKNRRESFIAVVESDSSNSYIYPEFINNNHFSQLYEESSSNQRSFALSVYDVNVTDSGNYTCLFNETSEKTYDVRVMGCTNCLINPLKRSGPDKKLIRCNLINLHGSQLVRPVNITLNMSKKKAAIIKQNSLTFNILGARLYKGINIELNPYPESANLGSNITCIVPPQPSTHRPTSSIVTTTKYDHPSTSSKSPSSSTLYTFTSHATISKTYNRSQNNTGSITLISSVSLVTSVSRTSNKSLENTNSDISNFMRNNATVLIIATIGSTVIVFLIVIIVVVRFKRARGGKENKPRKNETNCSVDDEAAPGEHDTCYESIEETSQMRQCKLMDNVLYESSDAMFESSTSRSCNRVETVLYTVPDKTGIINRVAKSKVIHDSSNSVILHGNNAIIRHHDPTEYKQEQEDQYVDMSGIGHGDDGGTNIPLYATPDKGPRSTRNTLKSRPGTTSPDDVADILLYAMPDKGPRSTKNAIMETRPGTTSPEDVADIPLYAMPDKGPRSTKNAMNKARPGGGLSSILTKDDIEDVDALYAEVDKPN